MFLDYFKKKKETMGKQHLSEYLLFTQQAVWGLNSKALGQKSTVFWLNL